MKAVIVGGGWCGNAAALSTQKQGDRVVLIERTESFGRMPFMPTGLT